MATYCSKTGYVSVNLWDPLSASSFILFIAPYSHWTQLERHRLAYKRIFNYFSFLNLTHIGRANEKAMFQHGLFHLPSFQKKCWDELIIHPNSPQIERGQLLMGSVIGRLQNYLSIYQWKLGHPNNILLENINYEIARGALRLLLV